MCLVKAKRRPPSAHTLPIGPITPGFSVSYDAGVDPVTPLLWIRNVNVNVRNNISRNNNSGNSSNSSASLNCARDDGATRKDCPPKAISSYHCVPAAWQRPYQRRRPFAKRLRPSLNSVDPTVTTSNRRALVDRRHRCPSWAHRRIRLIHRALRVPRVRRVRPVHRFTAPGFKRRRRVVRRSATPMPRSARGRLVCRAI